MGSISKVVIDPVYGYTGYKETISHRKTLYTDFIELPIKWDFPHLEEYESYCDHLEYVSLKSLLDKYELNFITRKLRELGKRGRLNIFDLSDYDEFSIITPKQISVVDFQRIIREIANEPLNISKYLHISFLRIDLESIGLDTLDDIQKSKITSLMQNIAKSAEVASEEVKICSAQEETKDQIIVNLCQALADTSPKYRRGHRINKSALSLQCSVGKMRYLFANSKGEDAYRAVLSKLDIPLNTH
ncbi:TPA: hypothetical protein ACU21S_002148 [Mannheimia haemolytica]